MPITSLTGRLVPNPLRPQEARCSSPPSVGRRGEVIQKWPINHPASQPIGRALHAFQYLRRHLGRRGEPPKPDCQKKAAWDRGQVTARTQAKVRR